MCRNPNGIGIHFITGLGKLFVPLGQIRIFKSKVDYYPRPQFFLEAITPLPPTKVLMEKQWLGRILLNAKKKSSGPQKACGAACGPRAAG